jgi:hypothetical protein
MPFKMGFLLNPAYCDRLNVQSDLLRGIFIGKYAYSIGIFAQKKMTKTLDGRFGINFVNNGEQTIQQPIWVKLNGNLFTSSSAEAIQLISNFYNIEIPIDIQWFINRKRSFFAIFGASPSYNFSKSGTVNFYTNGQLTTSNTSKRAGDAVLALALQFGMGYQKALNNNLLFEIQPKFRYYATNAANSRYMYNAGLQLNLIF